MGYFSFHINMSCLPVLYLDFSSITLPVKIINTWIFILIIHSSENDTHFIWKELTVPEVTPSYFSCY